MIMMKQPTMGIQPVQPNPMMRQPMFGINPVSPPSPGLTRPPMVGTQPVSPMPPPTMNAQPVMPMPPSRPVMGINQPVPQMLAKALRK